MQVQLLPQAACCSLRANSWLLSVDFVDEYSVFLDEGIAPGRFAAEKGLKGFVCPCTIFYSHLKSPSGFGVHGGCFELRRIHLSKAFKSLDGDLFGGIIQQQLLFVLLTVHVMEAPAESPSTMNNSVSSNRFEVQSASLPGIVRRLVALLRRTL